jgi:hypothetical protein
VLAEPVEDCFRRFAAAGPRLCADYEAVVVSSDPEEAFVTCGEGLVDRLHVAWKHGIVGGVGDRQRRNVEVRRSAARELTPDHVDNHACGVVSRPKPTGPKFVMSGRRPKIEP